jgi:inner membrane protein
MRFPLLVRTATILLIACGLLVPLAMIRGKVTERGERADGVQRAFAQETSGSQVIAGPFLALTCEETYTDERVVHRENGKPLTVREKKQRPCETAFFPPRSLGAQGALPIEQRFRGIYPIRLYRAAIQMAGEFERPSPPQSANDAARVWKDAYLVLAVSDVRGIKNIPIAMVGEAQRPFAPGPRHPAIKAGLHADLGSYAGLPEAEALAFRFSLELTGTGRLELAPVAGTNTVRLASAWPHPSFVGAFPPDDRSISPDGFAAAWRVNHFATGGNGFWRERAERGDLFASPRLLGVALVEPVNTYSLAYRATQYGFLFILLTFAALLLVEVIWRVSMHPAQYLLVGSALAVFFLVLIALSEHVDFAWAYLCAAGACIALLTWYLRHPLASPARTSVFAALFLALYGALYVLLQSEDYALLLGALLVFAALAGVMIVTRRLDWNKLAQKTMTPLPVD